PAPAPSRRAEPTIRRRPACRQGPRVPRTETASRNCVKEQWVQVTGRTEKKVIRVNLSGKSQTMPTAQFGVLLLHIGQTGNFPSLFLNHDITSDSTCCGVSATVSPSLVVAGMLKQHRTLDVALSQQERPGGEGDGGGIGRGCPPSASSRGLFFSTDAL